MNKYKNKHNVMNKKHLYEAPETELILVKFEGNFCASPVAGEAGETNSYNPYKEDF